MKACDLVAQNQILDGFDSLDETAFNQRTNLNMRRKRIMQCCSVSKRRESEAIDLILSKVEMDFLLNLIKLSDPEPRLYTLDSCIEVFNENFVKDCPYYIQMQMNKKVRYAKGCHQILPENQRVVVWNGWVMRSHIIGLRLWSIWLFWERMKWKWRRLGRRVACFLGSLEGPLMKNCSIKWKLPWRIRTLICLLLFRRHITCNSCTCYLFGVCLLLEMWRGCGGCEVQCVSMGIC